MRSARFYSLQFQSGFPKVLSHTPVLPAGLRKRRSPVRGVEAETKKKRRVTTMITLIIACAAVAGLIYIAGYDYRAVRK